MIEQHLEKLRSFYVAAQERSLLRASEVLGVTQPAITKSIRAIESQLDTMLLVRHNRGVELTAAGELMYQFCDGLFLKARSVERQIKHAGELTGIMRIGTYETLGELFWPKVLKLIHKNYPQLTIELTTQDPTNIWTRLTYGGLDLIVDAEPRVSDTLFSRVLYTDRFGIFCKVGSRFLKGTDSECIPISYVRKATDRKGVAVEEHLRMLSTPFECLYSVESFTLARSFVLEDVCVGVLPLSMAKRYVEKGTMQSFLSPQKYFGEHRVCATVLDHAKNDPKTKALIAILKTHAMTAFTG